MNTWKYKVVNTWMDQYRDKMVWMDEMKYLVCKLGITDGVTSNGKMYEIKYLMCKLGITDGITSNGKVVSLVEELRNY